MVICQLDFCLTDCCPCGLLLSHDVLNHTSELFTPRDLFQTTFWSLRLEHHLSSPCCSREVLNFMRIEVVPYVKYRFRAEGNYLQKNTSQENKMMQVQRVRSIGNLRYQ